MFKKKFNVPQLTFLQHVHTHPSTHPPIPLPGKLILIISPGNLLDVPGPTILHGMAIRLRQP